MSKKLTNDDYCRAAKKLRCEVAAIKAVASVESAGEGFYSDGFPVILYERHLFRKFTQGRYNADYPELSGAAGNYGAAGANQRRKFNAAFALNPTAAMRACSWGKFQILGDNYRICGYPSVDAFVDGMKESEGKHLDAFVAFVIGNGLDKHLREKQWARFARGYNGPRYKQNAYDTKIANAYTRFAKENIDYSTILAAASNANSGNDDTTTSGQVIPDSTQSPPPNLEPTKVIEQVEDDGTTKTVVSESVPDLSTPVTVSKEQYQGVGLIAVLKKDFAAVTGGNFTFQALNEYATAASGWPEWVVALITKLSIIAIIAGVGWLLYRLIHYIIWKVDQMHWTALQGKINTDPNRRDIERV